MCMSLATLDTRSQRSIQATSKEGKDSGIELVKPPENSKIGDRVYFEGPNFEGERTLSFIITHWRFNTCFSFQMQRLYLS